MQSHLGIETPSLEEYEKAISNEIIFYENKIKRYNEIINKLKNEKK